jgi:serine phosphatase RsbU (regulator of sigma subunit)
LYILSLLTTCFCMKRAELITGFLAGALFLGGAILELVGIKAGAILMITATLLFLFAYIPLMRVLRRRDHLDLDLQQEEIMAQGEEILSQRDMVMKQKELIEKNHLEISSSIEYARRLQASILPSPGLLRTRISDHFVVLMPRQKVSGDFYWWTQIEDHLVIAAVDCTGHGVPGAFMSMLGVSMLREIVSKEYISHPGVILRRLRKEVMYALKQTGEPGEQKDGMDMSLVSIHVDTLECQFAGANNPLYLVRDGEFTEYEADRQPIAVYQNMARFTTHDIQLQRGDHLYMFSDGYADQFGGPDGKKFKYNAFRQMLRDNAGLPMKKQKDIVETTFLEWRGDNDQVDDVVVLGLEI